MKKRDHQLIQQVLDGTVSPEEFAAFQQRLRTDDNLAKHYGDYALLHHSLCEEYGEKPAPSAGPVHASANSGGWRWFAAAAAIALVAAASYGIVRSRAAAAVPPGAPIEFSADAVWRVENDGPGGKLPRGATLQLACGQSEIVPGAGISAVIEGPAALTYISPDSLHLAGGRGRFRVAAPAKSQELSTSAFSVTAMPGADFAVDCSPGQPHEVHVFEGNAAVRINGHKVSETLTAGQAGRIAGPDDLAYFSADPAKFPDSIRPFETVRSGKFDKSLWRIGHGNPSIAAGRIEGVNFAAFRALSRPVPDESAPVLLATLDVGRPSEADFHTDGWTGLSFYSQGTEKIFFGDSFGPERTWSLDVKQRVPVVLPAKPVIGPRVVTLRYDRRTGLVSLHQGAGPLDAPFCSGILPKDLSFDEIRLAASADAAIAVRAITIRAGG